MVLRPFEPDVGNSNVGIIIMNTKGNGTSVFQNGLIWFGAAVSIAEIETGSQLAAYARGNLFSVFTAIVLGHIIGGVLLFLAGLIGARARQSAMNCVKVPFGVFGAGFFAFANLIQLVGWTAVMLASGAAAVAVLLPSLSFNLLVACIGILVVLWIFIGLRDLSKINTVALSGLFALAVFLCFKLFGFTCGEVITSSDVAFDSSRAFLSALELSIAMPLSWLPLIADYTKDAERPLASSVSSAVVYSFVSIWMYLIGLGVAYFYDGAGFAESILKAGVGVVGILVVVFSTVTTTFLDAYSAGESARSMNGRIPPRGVAVAVCLLGIIIAIYVGMERYIDFLYMIASIFAPMVAVLLVDWFVLGRRSSSRVGSLFNVSAWFLGLIVYHLSLQFNFILGAALPSMFAAGIIASAKGLLPSRFYGLKEVK